MDTRAVNEITNWNSLDEVLNRSWTMLSRGAAVSTDPFHTPVLGTTGLDGSSRLRTVVLRKATASERILICHTDVRTGKVDEIQHDARISWLFYHPPQKVQLRLRGQAILHADDPVADQQWAATKMISRRNYCGLLPPGTSTDMPSSGLPDFLITRPPTLAESEAGRKNFVAISCRVDFMDWLLLTARGNFRAQFTWDGDKLIATWLTP